MRPKTVTTLLVNVGLVLSLAAAPVPDSEPDWRMPRRTDRIILPSPSLSYTRAPYTHNTQFFPVVWNFYDSVPIYSYFYFCPSNLWSLMLSENRQQYKGIPTWLDHWHPTIGYLCKLKTTKDVDWPRHRCKLLPSPPGHWHLLSDGSFFANFILTLRLLDVHLSTSNYSSCEDKLLFLSRRPAPPRFSFRTSARHPNGFWRSAQR